MVAKKYLELMPPKDLLHAVARRIAPNLPEKDRKAFIEIMQSPGIEKEAYRITLASLVKNFTLGELNAMVTFYGSPDGQSAVKKFTPLMAEVMPQIQQEVKKALAQTQQEPESKEVPKAQGQAKPPNPKSKAKRNRRTPRSKKPCQESNKLRGGLDLPPPKTDPQVKLVVDLDMSRKRCRRSRPPGSWGWERRSSDAFGWSLFDLFHPFPGQGSLRFQSSKAWVACNRCRFSHFLMCSTCFFLIFSGRF